MKNRKNGKYNFDFKIENMEDMHFRFDTEEEIPLSDLESIMQFKAKNRKKLNRKKRRMM